MATTDEKTPIIIDHDGGGAAFLPINQSRPLAGVWALDILHGADKGMSDEQFREWAMEDPNRLLPLIRLEKGPFVYRGLLLFGTKRETIFPNVVIDAASRVFGVTRCAGETDDMFKERLCNSVSHRGHIHGQLNAIIGEVVSSFILGQDTPAMRNHMKHAIENRVREALPVTFTFKVEITGDPGAPQVRVIENR